MKKAIKTVLPDSAINFLKNEKDVIDRIPADVIAALHPMRRQSIKAIRELKDCHKGERCFVIGNGPSLRNTDMTRLRGEFTFGLNRIFLAFDELGFSTSCLVSINDLVVEQSAAEIQSLAIPKFISWRARRWLTAQNNLNFLYTTYTGPKFAKNAAGRLWEGATVTYVALQLAFHFGFSEVVLIGVDHSFATQGTPNTTVVSQGDDPNHFNPKYFGKGFRWQLPDLETSEIAYRMAKHAYESESRRILDATVGGKLQIFPKVDYNSLF